MCTFRINSMCCLLIDSSLLKAGRALEMKADSLITILPPSEQLNSGTDRRNRGWFCSGLQPGQASRGGRFRTAILPTSWFHPLPLLTVAPFVDNTHAHTHARTSTQLEPLVGECMHTYRGVTKHCPQNLTGLLSVSSRHHFLHLPPSPPGKNTRNKLE